MNRNQCVVGEYGEVQHKNDLIVSDCPGLDEQADERFQFTLDSQSGEIRSKKDPNLCIDASDSDTADGFRVLQFYNCHGGDNQKFAW